MPSYPDRTQQMLAVHGDFIRQFVEATQTPGREQDLQVLLDSARASGWNALVRALRQISGGRRDSAVLKGLDEEDRVIAEAILRGLQDPSSLPSPNEKPSPTLAAPGIAGMLHAASTGHPQALQLIADMAQQMSQVGGDMGRLAAVIRPMINGERNPDILCEGMTTQGEQLVLNILSELAKIDVH